MFTLTELLVMRDNPQFNRKLKQHYKELTRARRVRVAVHLVSVHAYADSAAERRCWVTARAPPRLHRHAAALRARRPRGPAAPGAVHCAVSDLDGGARAAVSAVRGRRVVTPARGAQTLVCRVIVSGVRARRPR